MADAVDRPRTGGGEFSPALPGPDSLRDLASPEGSGPAYRPLSLTAVVGFCLAVLYGLMVVLGALFTFLTGDHFLLGTWTAALPVVVIVICLIGRSAIRSSEGVLGGTKLANWGVGLCVVCGLGYWSYYAATILALRQQAVAFVESQYLPALKKGNTGEAFLLTFTPPRPQMPPADLKKYIEQNINVQLSLKSPGRFTAFDQTDYVRLIHAGGEATKVALTTIATPSVQRGGVEVPLTFHVETPVKSFDLFIVARATEAATGREWQIMENKTGTLVNSTTWNNEGTLLFQKNEPAAREFANAWVSKIAGKLDTEGAFLYTLPADVRIRVVPKIKGKSDAELNKAAENDPDVSEYVKGVADFRAGGAIRVDPRVFWAPEGTNAKVVEAAKKKFLTAYATSNWCSILGAVPLWEEKDKKLRFYYDTFVVLLPDFVVGGRIAVEADVDKLTADSARDPNSWRVVSMELIRAHAAPRPEPQNPR